MRVIDEETLKTVDVEFIMKQETNRAGFRKEKIFNNQIIRTNENIRVQQLKKLIKAKVVQDNPNGYGCEIYSSSIKLFIYSPKVMIYLNNLYRDLLI